MENKYFCNLCPHKCEVNRNTNVGFCKAGAQAVVAKTMLHHWEEPCISCKNGSGTIFFSGCSLRCVYCQNQLISRGTNVGKVYSSLELSELFKELEDAGADNINLVTPTHFVPSIIGALDYYKPKIPIVYNSSGYENIETLRLLEPYVDIYLIDFKYCDPVLAKNYSNAENYPEVAKNAISECLRQKPTPIMSGNKMLSGVIIRHLLLPQGTNNAIHIANWVADNARNSYFSLMSQYIPCGDDLPKSLQRKITKREYNKVVNHILDLGIKNVFLQDFESADKCYIPDF